MNFPNGASEMSHCGEHPPRVYWQNFVGAFAGGWNVSFWTYIVLQDWWVWWAITLVMLHYGLLGLVWEHEKQRRQIVPNESDASYRKDRWLRALLSTTLCFGYVACSSWAFIVGVDFLYYALEAITFLLMFVMAVCIWLIRDRDERTDVYVDRPKPGPFD